jgi:integrase
MCTTNPVPKNFHLRGVKVKRPEFESIFKEELDSYLDHKVALGFQESSFTIRLRLFGKFCISNALYLPIFTEELCNEWCKRRSKEASTTQYVRINEIKHFLIYLHKKGYNIHVPRDIKYRFTEFKPHIYTDDEIIIYFNAVDSFEFYKSKINKLQYPLLFRILYCCGPRISETLCIRKKDLDLEEGIVKLVKTKNQRERFIVLHDSLSSLMRRYADKYFYLLGPHDYIFKSTSGGQCRTDTVYEHHRMFLTSANIPYIGNSEGPRVHDWRHTFSVNSLKQMINTGMDMYVALPILSAYLGHKTIQATERYVQLTKSVFPHIEEKIRDIMKAVFRDRGELS